MTSGQDDDLAQIYALREEIRRLRLEIGQLRKKNEDLLRTLSDRDFERPPHYR
ncbi:MAG TPA: hypothetical protein VNE42_05430 [Acidimicrobiales bacterium]|nr:hypothetical protein [Acidimicrobiales bacterium]